MKNGKFAIIITTILLFVFAFCYSNFINVNKERDSVKFKKEYEALNGVVVDDYYKYQKLDIDSNNPIKYSNYDEIFDVIDNKSGIIYLGFPECPWCRTILPVLFKTANDYKIDTIYYLNILNERDSYEVSDGKLVYSKDSNGKEKKGTKNYFKLLKKLDKFLEDYTVSDKSGKEYEVGEKRLYAPTVVFVKDGEILGIHVSSVDSQKSGFDKLTKDQKDELYSIYESYIIKLKNLVCNEKC